MEVQITPLTPRQVRMIETLLKGGHKKLSELNAGFSEDIANRDMADLVTRKIVKKIGRTKASRYSLAPGAVVVALTFLK